MRTVKLCLIVIMLGLAGLSLSTAAADDAGVPIAGFLDSGSASGSATPSADAGSGSAAIAAPQAAPALPDPIAAPVESVSFVVKLWKTGTMPAAIIVGLFLLLTALSRKVKWLQSGYAAIATAALLGGCSMLIERASAGTTPNASMFATALITALALALKPKQPMGPPAPAPAEPAK